MEESHFHFNIFKDQVLYSTLGGPRKQIETNINFNSKMLKYSLMLFLLVIWITGTLLLLDYIKSL